MAGWPWPLDGIQAWFDGLWDWISTAAQGAVSIVQGWINSGLEWLRGEVSGFATWIVESVGGVVGGIASTISGVITAATSAVQTALGLLIQGVSDAVSGIGTFLGNAISGIGTTLGNAIAALPKTIGDVVTGIGTGLGSIASWISTAVSNFGKWLGDLVWSWVEGSLKWLTDTFKWLYNSVAAAVESTGGAILNGVMGALGSLGEALTRGLGDLLSGVAKALGDAIQGLWAFLSTEVPAFLASAASFINEAVIQPILTGLSWIFDKIKGIATALISAVADLFKGHSPIKPEEALGIGVAGIGLALTAGAVAPLIVDLASTKIVATGLDLRSIGEYINKLIDPGMFTGAVLGVLVGAGVKQPLTYYYNKLFRPAIPSTSQADQMLFEGNIDEAKWKAVYEYWGWKDEDIAAWQKTMYREPAQRTLLTMLEDPEVPEAWVRKKIAETGFSAEDIDAMIEYKRRLLASKASDQLASHVSLLIANKKLDHVKGYITEDTLKADLEALGLNADLVSYHVADAKSDRERKRRDNLVTYYVDAHIKDLVTEEELRDRLIKIIPDPEAVDLEISKTYVRKYQKPKPPRATTEDKAAEEAMKYQVAYLIQLFRNYAIEKDELINKLVEAGVDPTVALARAQYEGLTRPIPKPSPGAIARAKEEAKVQTVQVRAAVQEFRSYIVDESELLDRLIKLGLSEAMATATVQLESIKRPPPPIPPEEVEARRLEARIRSLRTTALVEQYRRFSIEKPELIAGLVGIDVDLAEAKAIADLEETRRPTPKPSAAEVEARRLEERVRSLRTKVLTEQYIRYIIRKDEYIRELVRLGLDPEEASAMADLEELRRPVPGPTPAEIEVRREVARILKLREEEAVGKFRAELITAEALRTSLLGLGYSADLTQAIVNLEMVRRPPPPIPPEEIERRKREERLRTLRTRTLIEQYRSYTIEKDELIAGLVVAGWDLSEAQATADLEEARRPTVKPSPAEVERARLEERLRSLRTRTLIEQYRVYTIEKDELVSSLVEVGLDPEEARAAADLEEVRRPALKPSPEEIELARLEERVRSIWVKALIERYKRYYWDRSEFLEGLIELGVDPTEAAAIVDLETVRRPALKPSPEEIAAGKEAAQIQKLRAAALIARFRRGEISLDDLVNGLMALDYGEELASAMADLEQAKLKPAV